MVPSHSDLLKLGWDISYAVDSVKQEYMYAAWQTARPSVVFKPTLERVADSEWCATFGRDLFCYGKTPADAMAAFDKAWIDKNPAGTTPHTGGKDSP